MTHKVTHCFYPVAFAVVIGSCGGGEGRRDGIDSDSKGDSETDTYSDATSVSSDTWPDTRQDTAGAPSDTGDTGVPENERPPALPLLCRLVTEPGGDEAVGQFELTGPGDGRDPDIQLIDGAEGTSLLTWAYFGSVEEGGDRWEIQVAPYHTAVVANDGGLTNEHAVGKILNPFIIGPVSESPRLAGKEGEIGVVWRDGRFDPNCEVSAFQECKRDLAFSKVGFDGVALGDFAIPKQITFEASVKLMPAIAATPNGYIVSWIETRDSVRALMAVRLDENGEVVATQKLSDDLTGVNGYGHVSLTTNDLRTVAVWASEDESHLLSRAWDHDQAAPEPAPRVINNEYSLYQNTRIVQGGNRFLISWSSPLDGDNEIFTEVLDAAGKPTGGAQRITWTDSGELNSNVAWNGTAFAVVWQSIKENGSAACAVEQCNDQVYAALLGENGAPAGAPVQISNDINQSQSAVISWDGVGWTALWALRGNNRWRIFSGQIVCD